MYCKSHCEKNDYSKQQCAEIVQNFINKCLKTIKISKICKLTLALYLGQWMRNNNCFPVLPEYKASWRGKEMVVNLNVLPTQGSWQVGCELMVTINSLNHHFLTPARLAT